MSDRAAAHFAKYHWYMKGGGIPVGGEHIDELVRGEGLLKLVRCICKGKTVTESLQEAIEETRLIIRNWNKSREYQVHRWEDTCVGLLEDTARRLGWGKETSAK